MNIELCYVNGINRIDTPYFSSLSEQSTWFSNKVVCSIETTFYPPHYQNKIRCSIDDIDFTDSCNYLYFTFRGKTYYYFIDDITYINESLIELDITMDYIQTYMFNIRINNGVIEREFNNRWIRVGNEWKLTRGYIRENVSGGLFEKQTKQFFDKNNIYVAVLKSTAPLCKGGQDKVTTSIGSISGRFQSGYHYTFFILNNLRNIRAVEYEGMIYSVDEQVNPFMDMILGMALRSPVVCDAYITSIDMLPDLFRYDDDPHSETYRMLFVLNPFEDEGYKPYLLEAYVPQPSDEYIPLVFSWYGHSETMIWHLVLAKYPLFEKDVPIEYFANNFSRNTSKNVNFSTSYITELIDENYVYISAGKNSALSTFPTHYMKDLTLNYKELFNLSNGTSSCGLYHNQRNVSEDNYSTFVTYTNVNTIDLINDTWDNYVANNKNRWASAGLSAGLSALDAFVSIATTATFTTKSLNRLYNDKRSYTRKRGLLKVGASRHAEKLTDSAMQSVISDATDLAGGIISPLVNQAITDSNMQQAPDTPKQIGECLVNSNAYDIKSYYQVYRVNDFVQCANYYHRNGHKVERYVSNVNNIFSEVQNRYYFNILKMSDVELTLYNVNSDETSIQGIRERLMDGVRLWNINNQGVTMGDFTYDNVELAFIEQ